MTMHLGPVEYLLVGFPGNRFSGEIVPALAALVESGTINIIDLAFVKKDEDGTVTAFEYDQVDELAALADIDAEVGGFLSEEDLTETAEGLEPGNAAALLVWENLWAKRFAEAMRAADGVVISAGLVPEDALLEILASHSEGSAS